MDNATDLSHGLPSPAQREISSASMASIASESGLDKFSDLQQREHHNTAILSNGDLAKQRTQSTKDEREIEDPKRRTEASSEHETEKTLPKDTYTIDSRKQEISNTGIGTMAVPYCDQRCERCISQIQARVIPYFRGDNSETLYQKSGPYFSSVFEIAKHHDSLGALRVSAISGCHLCTLLAASNPIYPFSYDENNTKSYTINVVISAALPSQVGSVHCALKIFDDEYHASNSVHLSIANYNYQLGRTLRFLSTDAPEIRQLTNKWLKTCLEKHGDCRRAARSLDSQAFIPTRLIKIKSEGDRVLSARLIFSALTLPVSYLTLSHCWGGADVFRLTQSTLQSFHDGIPLSKLPKTFTEALQITVTLGYKYIWIDSLCIIQDSNEDWEYEANIMGNIYQNSLCTIAATGAKNSQGGFFHQRSAMTMLPCQIRMEGSEAGSIFATHLNGNQRYMPLHSRAWVVQERCLAVRTINFGLDQVTWTCVTGDASEKEPKMRLESEELGSGYYIGPNLCRPFHGILHNLHRKSFNINSWRNILVEYARCDMTYATDKWPAIQGIASQVSKARSEILFHGLWRDMLVTELLWQVVSFNHERLTFGAPSWSWLSIKGEITFSSIMGEDDDTLICAKIKEPNISIYETSNQELEITARVFFFGSDDVSRSYGHCIYNGEHGLATKSGKAWRTHFVQDIPEDIRGDSYAIRLTRKGWRCHSGLVIVPVHNHKRVWRRVGLYHTEWYCQRDWISYYEDIEKAGGDIGQAITVRLV